MKKNIFCALSDNYADDEKLNVISSEDVGRS
jgi:hypothetical protein